MDTDPATVPGDLAPAVPVLSLDVLRGCWPGYQFDWNFRERVFQGSRGGQIVVRAKTLDELWQRTRKAEIIRNASE